MVSSKCPQCNREEAFAITTINYQLLELIKHFNSMKEGGSSSGQTLLDDKETKRVVEVNMDIVNTTECIICYNEYDTDSRKPCIGTCGHSICESCKHQISSKCPQCNREEAFAITTINYQLLELIKHFNSMKEGGSLSGQTLLDDKETKRVVEVNMDIVNTTECIICYHEYDNSRRPCFGTCGHSICGSCEYEMVSSKCPLCDQEKAFAITTINYLALDIIEGFKNMQADDSSNFQVIDEGICSECTLRCRKRRICIPCAEKAGVLKQDGVKNEIVLNIENADVGAALRKAKTIAICADCALDGVQHYGHKTMQLTVLRNNLDDKIHHKGHTAHQSTVLQSNIADRDTASLRGRIDLKVSGESLEQI
ncbi:hypothetical protein GCK72_017275 [Caenorhabditis remanei]|uniref:RING-type domain-containing protein n=1 Tax=Caenorhabditis remanei TaxID=31234 RepID=A0A6A5G831_CAERE|nr:hypothetical protein GCK72_017275 [Caenorhabditis remanei]KAF1750724.1 hypothetical protein GCK72_017275 [Caenorhabditis remanei]